MSKDWLKNHVNITHRYPHAIAIRNQGFQRSQERMTGIDILKVLSMFLVVMMHLLMYGGILGNVTSSYGSISYDTAWLLECLTFCCVNCFALITGYLCINSRWKWQRLFSLWLEVALYGAAIALLFQVVFPGKMTSQDWVDSLMPVSHGTYWYLNAYIIMFFAIPIVNAAVKSLNDKVLKEICSAFFVIVVCLPIVTGTTGNDVFKIHSGYCGLWLCFLYTIGANVRKNHWFDGVPKPFLIAMIIISISVDWSKCLTGVPTSDWYGMVSYDSITVLIESICLLLLFKDITVEKNSKIAKLWAGLAKSSFGVYVISVQPLVFDYVLGGAFTWVSSSSPVLLTFETFASALLVYLICTMIESIRIAMARAFNRIIENDRKIPAP